MCSFHDSMRSVATSTRGSTPAPGGGGGKSSSPVVYNYINK
jgi:hypothetical protein